MFKDSAYFYNMQTTNKVVNWGKAGALKIQAIGDIYIKLGPTILCLHSAWYIPELGVNLISAGRLNNINICLGDNVSLTYKNQNKPFIIGKSLITILILYRVL